MIDNPLLSYDDLPSFSAIRPKHVEPAIFHLLDQACAAIHARLQQGPPYHWNELITLLETWDNRLNKAWAPVSHLNAVCNNENMRAAYNACLPALSAYATEMGQNAALYQAYLSLRDSAEYATLDIAARQLIDHALRDFKLTGVALPPDQQARCKTINQRLSQLSSQFEENLLDATYAWRKPIASLDALAGLPPSALAMLKQNAERDGLDGWLLTLEFPCYQAIMTYADDRALREEVYLAYVTRASDQGPHAGRWNNGPVMEEILALRHEKAQLLGFADYAALSLATKMADHPEKVLGFLNDLAQRAKPRAERDLDELRSFAKDQDGIANLQAWDIGYYSEKLRQQRYQLSQEALKAYFPITRVLPGLFAIVERLYGLRVTELTDFDSWHPDVRLFALYDQAGQLRGRFYLDLYARPHKRSGAWMDDCKGRVRLGDRLQTPVAFLVCNFTPPTSDTPALLTHDEVTTLFHEFGHGLHHLLTQVDHLGVSGINGVEWDAVELPSQFMENWCWEHEALTLISGHYQTGEALPQAMLQNLRAAKHFQAGMLMVRQLEFALFDYRLHREYDPQRGGRIYEILDEVRHHVAVVRPPTYNRFAHGFSHIFAGGYGAGYYSYKWAEVLSSDAFSLFEETGIFNPLTGQAFLTHILEKGGSENAMALFVKFRGREPSIDALLRHSGIEESVV